MKICKKRKIEKYEQYSSRSRRRLCDEFTYITCILLCVLRVTRWKYSMPSVRWSAEKNCRENLQRKTHRKRLSASTANNFVKTVLLSLEESFCQGNVHVQVQIENRFDAFFSQIRESRANPRVISSGSDSEKWVRKDEKWWTWPKYSDESPKCEMEYKREHKEYKKCQKLNFVTFLWVLNKWCLFACLMPVITRRK